MAVMIVTTKVSDDSHANWLSALGEALIQSSIGITISAHIHVARALHLRVWSVAMLMYLCMKVAQ